MNQLTYSELQKWKATNKSFQLIDVREPDEHEACNIGGQLIPLNSILRKTELLDFSQPIVIYCKRGIRSQLAIQRLAIRFPEAQFYNLSQGIMHLFSV
ncbi:MAG: rhodanese-like domain-containing protein [Saprospiraceae bacterium]|nr:rhodanese-like domain-containing protein [Saprospiraceae bacterium]